MNLETYNPFSDRIIVYHSSNDILNQIDGMVSTFLLALLNQYQFKIGNLSNTLLHEVFTSPVSWWGDEWFQTRHKRGIWNLRYTTTEDEFVLSNILLYKKRPYSQVVHVYCEDNLLPLIMKNSMYKEFIEKYEVGKEGNVYKEVVKNLFYSFEGDWQENFEHLKSTFFAEENRMVARILSKTKLKELSSIIDDKKPKQVLVSTKDLVLLQTLKDTHPDVKFLHVVDIKNEEYNPVTLSTIKLFYELFLFIDTEIKFLDDDDKFSDIVKNCVD
jgi:hypothetical protein